MRGQLKGGEIWAIRLLGAILLILWAPSYLGNSPSNELPWRILATFVFIVALLGERGLKLIIEIVKTKK